MNGPAPSAKKRWLDGGYSALSLLVLLVLGLSLWPRSPVPDAPELPDNTPGWATFNDLVLAGPDAGEWGASAMALYEGRLEDLDRHRMPTWTLLAAAFLHLYPRAALAGHLLNHLLMLLLPIIVFLLSRQVMGRGSAFGAALVVTFCTPLVLASRRYGVDLVVATLIPATLLAATIAARRWWLAPLAGLVAGLCAISHYTAIAYPVPPLLLLLFLGRGIWRRLASGTLFIVFTVATVILVFQFFPTPNLDQAARDVAEGISRGAHHTGQPIIYAAQDALAVLETGQHEALRHAAATMMIRIVPAWMSWRTASALLWLGLIGLLLPPGPNWRRRWTLPFQGLRTGIPLALCLAPLPLLAAAGASERYSLNLLPIATILFVRGLDTLPAVTDQLLRRRWAGWPMGLLGLPMAVILGLTAWRVAEPWLEVHSADYRDVATWKLSQALAAEFPPGGHIAGPLREANVMAGRAYCPTTVCPLVADEADFKRCLAIMDEECGGEGELAYVAIDQAAFDPRTEPRKAMDRWIITRWSPRQEVIAPQFKAWVLAIPRAEIRAQSK